MYNFPNLTNSDVSCLIDKRIRGRNAERNRMLLKRKLLDGLTYEQVAEEFDSSVRQTKSIVYHCLDKIV